MTFLLDLHSALRWVLVVVAVAAAFRFLVGWRRKAAYGGPDRALSSTFSGLMDLQLLMGIIFLVWNGLAGAGFPLYRIEHGVMMLLAAITAHLPMRWRAAPAPVRFRNSLFAVVGALLLVILGVFILPGGWTR